MIDVQHPVTADQFREFFEDKFKYLFSDTPHRGFAHHFGELNQMILFAQADNLTKARQFTGDELQDLELDLVTLSMTRFNGQRERTWQDFLKKMRELGLAEELLPQAEACGI